MAAKFLDIKAMMGAVDRRDKAWYNRLSEEDKKLYSPYMTMRWSASAEDKGLQAEDPDLHRNIQEYYVTEVNEKVNKHHWTLSKNHKALLWQLNAMCGSTFGRLYHPWISSKKKATTKTKTKDKKSKMQQLQDLFPNAKQKDLEVLDATMSTKEFTELKSQYGIDK
jgi:hypothetical protein